MTSSEQIMGLSKEQLEQFATDGYVIVENALEDADIDPVIEEYSAHIDRRAHELLEEGKISSLHEEEPFEQRLASICKENGEIYPELDIYRLRTKAGFHFLRNENLIDVVECIVGSEITCSPIQHLRAKLPSGLMEGGRDGHVAPWHQDMGVTLEDADPHFILTVWLPLTKATVANGCLEILPRTHTGDLIQHVSRAGTGTVIPEETLPDVEPLPLEMEKGSVLLIHKRIPHRSGKNCSDMIRWSMDLRYQESGTPTGRPHYPEFVVRSRSNPASELTDHGEWCRLWEEALAMEKARAEEGNPINPHRWKPEAVAL
jgi:phytanoyl-CoA hydroxylase